MNTVNNMNYNFNVKPVNKPKIEHTKNKNTFIANNMNKKTIYDIDMDRNVDIKEARCDYLIIEPDCNSAHFVELKGSDINHAFEQLENSMAIIENPKNKYLAGKFNKKSCYVIIHRSPAVSTKIQNKMNRFIKKLNSKLTVKTKQLEINIK